MHYESPIREPLILEDKTLHDITEDIARPVEGKANKWWWALFLFSLTAVMHVFLEFNVKFSNL